MAFKLLERVSLRDEDQATASLGSRDGAVHLVPLLEEDDGTLADVEGNLQRGHCESTSLNSVIGPEDGLGDRGNAAVAVRLHGKVFRDSHLRRGHPVSRNPGKALGISLA